MEIPLIGFILIVAFLSFAAGWNVAIDSVKDKLKSNVCPVCGKNAWEHPVMCKPEQG